MTTIGRDRLRRIVSQIDADATVEYSYMGRYGDRCVGVVCASPVRFAVELGFFLALCVEEVSMSPAIVEAFRRPQVEDEVIYWPRLAASSTPDPTRIKLELKRIRPGLYETVGHTSPSHAFTIEEIRPGHECHEQLGTGWLLTDARGMGVWTFDTLREAEAALRRHMGA